MQAMPDAVLSTAAAVAASPKPEGFLEPGAPRRTRSAYHLIRSRDDTGSQWELDWIHWPVLPLDLILDCRYVERVPHMRWSRRKQFSEVRPRPFAGRECPAATT